MDSIVTELFSSRLFCLALLATWLGSAGRALVVRSAPPKPAVIDKVPIKTQQHASVKPSVRAGVIAHPFASGTRAMGACMHASH